jgi:hypothetical protein
MYIPPFPKICFLDEEWPYCMLHANNIFHNWLTFMNLCIKVMKPEVTVRRKIILFLQFGRHNIRIKNSPMPEASRLSWNSGKFGVGWLHQKFWANLIPVIIGQI